MIDFSMPVQLKVTSRTAFLIAGGALFVSLMFPYLVIVFTSPQYPTRSPKIYLYTHTMTGNLTDWEVVGRYIGVDPTPDLPELRYPIVPIIYTLVALLLFVAAFRDNKMRKFASVVLLAVTLFSGGWGQFRLYQQGHNLDPRAPMRSIVKPFTPPLIGVTRMSKIRIYHLPHVGMLLCTLAVGITLYTAWYRKD